MSDFGAVTPREEPFDAAHDAVRDALPALLHGRVTASARAELDTHLASCRACEADVRTLAAIRDLYATPTAGVSIDRIAAAVRARTVVASASSLDVGDGAPGLARPGHAPIAHYRRAAAVPRRAPAWARRGGVRAFAASALLAIGSGVMLVSRAPTAPTHRATAAVVASATAAVPHAAPTPDANGSLLGASFSDLSDSELAAVVAAVDDPASPTPAAEPAPVTPTVLAPDGE